MKLNTQAEQKPKHPNTQIGIGSLGLWVLLSCSVAFSFSAVAANVYIRDGASGSGADWSNALDDLPATLTRGNTYYIADGSYGAYYFDDAPSGTTLITVKKATVAEHGSSTGWSDAYGDGQAIWSAASDTWGFDTAYMLFDGVTGTGFGDTAYGFKVQGTSWPASVISCYGIGFPTRECTNLTFMNMEVQGVTFTSQANYVRLYDLQGRYLLPGQPNLGCDNIVISNNWMHGGAIAVNLTDADNITVEHCHFENFGALGGAEWHYAVLIFAFNMHGITVRYNTFRDARELGWTTWIEPQCYPGYNLYIYGNEFYVSSGLSYNSYCNEGIFTCAGSVSMDGLYIYNNTIANWAGGNAGIFLDTGSGVSANVFIRNNIWTNCVAASISDPNAVSVQSNNDFAANVLFINALTYDFRLAAAEGPGTFISSPFNMDRNGVTRGGDGVWDRGAFEYGGAADTNSPVISAVITASTNDVGAVITWTTDEAATSIVLYGLTGSYGSGVTNLAYVTSHSMTLTGLASSTEYFSQVRSADSSGNSSSSNNANFTTLSQDTLAPTNTLTAPTNGATISGTFNITATATDNIGVVGVQFYTDTTLLVDDTASPFSYLWNSGTVTNGAHTVWCVARDARTNTTYSATNSVTVTNYVSTNHIRWAFNEGTGTTVADSNGGTNILTLTNGAAWTTGGRLSGGVTLDGTNDWLIAPNSPEVNITTNLTVTCWVKATNLTDWFQIVVKPASETVFQAPFYCYHIYGEPGSDASHWVPSWQLVNSSQTSVYVNSSNEVTYGTWNHVAGSYDGSALKLYVNGGLQGSASQTGSILSSNTSLYIGVTGVGGYAMKGVIDEVRIYATALTANEIAAVYEFTDNTNVVVVYPPVNPRIK